MLPISKAGPGGANLIEALFTATSAICVTGHIIVDTPVFWTPFGHAVILALIQIGGIGVMSFATLLGLLVARRLGLRTRLTAVSKTHTLAIGDVRRVLRGVILIALGVEALCAIILALRAEQAEHEVFVSPGNAGIAQDATPVSVDPLDGGAVTLALATPVDHPIPGKVVVGIKTADVDAAAKEIEATGGAIIKGPYDDAHERRAVVYDNTGNGLVFYSPLKR